MTQVGSPSPASDPGTTASPTLYDPPDILPAGDVDPIVSQWQKLVSMDRQSPGFLPLLSSLIAGANRSSTIKLQGHDARIVLDALDEVFRNDKLSNEYYRDTLSVMRALAHDSSQVPPRYQVEPEALSVEAGVIAHGATSEVRKGKLGDKIVAVKTLKVDQQTDPRHLRKRFCKESIIWMSVSHPHILQLIAVDIDSHTGQCSMISEMMVNGNIKEYISRNPANRFRLLYEAAMRLNYLHKRGVIHGDLKGHNILITNEIPARACLADFGLSTLALSAPGGMTTTTTGGTPPYMAPELFYPEKFGETNSRPTQPTDIYAFGMVMYEVLTGFEPFYDRKFGPYELVPRVLAGERPKKPINAEKIGFGSGTWELVKECWRKKSAKRPTIERVLVHLARVSASSTSVGPSPQILQPDPRVILRQWRDLAARDPRSIDHQLLSALVSNRQNRDVTLKFRGKDAATIINTIDKVLKENRVPNETYLNAFQLLRKLAGDSRQVPKSYLVGILARYKVEERVIAFGGFATIREGRLKGLVVAAKTIRIGQESEIDAVYEAFCKECVLWMNLSHPNILQLLAVEIKPKIHKFSMISEMMTNGNILNYINAKKANRLHLLRDVAKGLEYLHRSGVIHGDLKGHNVLINNEAPPRACIADFGFSTIVRNVSLDPDMDEAAGGTYGYMAPELFGMGARPSREADTYSVGILVYQVITGTRPFGRHKVIELPILTIQGSRPFRPEDPMAIGFGQGTWEFIEKCWSGDPGQRPTAAEVLEHFKRVAGTSMAVEPGPKISIGGSADENPLRSFPVRSSVPVPVWASSGVDKQDSFFTYFCECRRQAGTVSSP